ncbi:MAG: filamentous hemagglutinin N-terminal domain-containing protein [Synechococcales cyanobacterium RM1_1_8]|nr:filamentous hemagglutinin N-terminal domain-containing protein [Synechococcales cyanobacterium RM1_1_8]
MSQALVFPLAYGVLGLGLFCPRSSAQTLPDASLGAEASVLMLEAGGEVISGGAVRDGGLFHSFEQLNVGEGRSLYFANPDGIGQIFSRVTGNGRSEILGTLGVLGNADLFLLNPNGIVFGPNARLDLSGSFVASTAESLQVSGFEFGTISPLPPPPLLRLNTPIGLQLGQNPGSIVHHSTADGVGLSVQPGQMLALIGGDLDLAGGALTVADGRIELGSLHNGTVGLTNTQSGWQFAYPIGGDAAVETGEGLNRGRISLGEQAQVTVNGVAGNSASGIHLWGGEIRLEGRSQLLSDNRSAGTGAAIRLDGQRLILGGGSQVTAQTWGSGGGGDILANLSDSIHLTSAQADGSIGNGSHILAATLGAGDAGDIHLQTRRFLNEYDSFVNNQAAVLSRGNGGSITLQAAESVLGRFYSPLTGQGGRIQVATQGSGNAGDLRLTTDRLQLIDNHVLSSVSWLAGNGGDIRVEAQSAMLAGLSPLIPQFSSTIQSVTYGTGRGGRFVPGDPGSDAAG